MEIKLEYILIFLVFIFSVQFVMCKCHCGFNRLVEGAVDTVEVDLTNLNLKYDSSKVYSYNDSDSEWYLYNGSYGDFKNAKNKVRNIQKISGISKVSDINSKTTLNKLKNADVYLISYSNYTGHCDSSLFGWFGNCARGLFTIYFDKQPNHRYTINWKTFSGKQESKIYCRQPNSSTQQLNGDIHTLTRFKREWSPNCNN